jgi:NAD(P)-dependent dehydrogenase (short-subunit alcohol dehydrogenase family)
MITQHNKQFCL